MNLLCIDDEPLALRLMTSMLEGKSEVDRVQSFDNAADALSCAETEAFDVAFVDIMLGTSNGLDFAGSLRALQPNCKIIYCTGYPQYAIESINRGIVDGYLLKPVEESRIVELLNRYRGQKALTVSSSGKQLSISDRLGQSVLFERRKTMQLFELLLARNGQGMSVDELCDSIWEHKADMIYKNRQYLYALTHDLSSTLKNHEASEVLIKTADGYALDMSQIKME